MLSEREFPIVDERVVSLAGVDVSQRVSVVRCGVHPLQRWSDRLLQFLESLLLRTASSNGKFRGFELQRTARPHFIPPENDQLRNVAVRIGSISYPVPLPIGGHLRCCNVSTPRR